MCREMSHPGDKGNGILADRKLVSGEWLIGEWRPLLCGGDGLGGN